MCAVEGADLYETRERILGIDRLGSRATEPSASGGQR